LSVAPARPHQSANKGHGQEHSGRQCIFFFVGMILLLLIAVALVHLSLVRVKMLPFDNKSELQVILNMPDGALLEQTSSVAQPLGNELAQQTDVLDYRTYTGTSGP
jgi:multidrug efflux pump subunit AcrB